MFSRLDLINEMLVSTGMRPLTAEQSTHPKYKKAEAKLNSVVNAINVMGLWYNTETRDITPQSNGEVIVPLGCISADPTNRHCNFSLRDSKLYDLDEGEFYVSDSGSDIELRMVFDLDVNDMPLAAKEYVKYRAIYEFYIDEDGAEPKLSSYRDNRDRAWADLNKEHLRRADFNNSDNPAHLAFKVRTGRSDRYRPIVR